MSTSQGESQKVALVTGGSSGIGRFIAVEFAKLGHKVAITGRDQKRLDESMELLVASSPVKPPAASDSFLALKVDFEQPAQVDKVVGDTVSKFGRLDIVINNAGYDGKGRQLSDEDFFEDFQKIIQVNLLAATRIAQLSVAHLEKTKGVLINVSSIADRIPMQAVSYAVSKAGMSMMGKSVANAVEGKGIRVLNVCPGPVQTNFAPNMEKASVITSFERVASSQEVADLVVFLASDKASFIHGTSIDIDGGTLCRFNGLAKLRIRDQ